MTTTLTKPTDKPIDIDTARRSAFLFAATGANHRFT